MGNKTKNGIRTYFVDSDKMNSEAMDEVNRRYPIIGWAVASAVTDFIFRERGYYARWEDDGREIIEEVSNRIHCDDVNLIRGILLALIETGFFSLDLFYRYGILSSVEYQKAFYLTAAKMHRKNKSIKPIYDLTGRFGDGPKHLTPSEIKMLSKASRSDSKSDSGNLGSCKPETLNGAQNAPETILGHIESSEGSEVAIPDVDKMARRAELELRLADVALPTFAPSVVTPKTGVVLSDLTPVEFVQVPDNLSQFDDSETIRIPDDFGQNFGEVYQVSQGEDGQAGDSEGDLEFLGREITAEKEEEENGKKNKRESSKERIRKKGKEGEESITINPTSKRVNEYLSNYVMGNHRFVYSLNNNKLINYYNLKLNNKSKLKPKKLQGKGKYNTLNRKFKNQTKNNFNFRERTMNHDQTFFQESDDQLLFQEWQESVELEKNRTAEPYASVIEAWNEFHEDRGVRFNDFEMNGMIKFQVDELWKQYPDIETFRAVFREAAENPIKSGKRVTPWQLKWVVRPNNFQMLLASSDKNNFGAPDRFIPKSEWDPVYHPAEPVDWDPTYTPEMDMSDMGWWEEARRKKAEWERTGKKRDVNDDANFLFQWQLDELAAQQAKEA